MNSRTTIALSIFLVTLYHFPATAGEDLAVVEEVKMAGIINSDSKSQRLLSTGDVTQIKIDSRYIVKGDRLDIYEKAKGVGRILKNRIASCCLVV